MDRIYLPVDIYFGANCVAQHGEHITSIGQKAFIVTGAHSAKASGAEADIVDLLKRIGKEYYIYSEVTENPEIEIIDKGISLFLYNKCDFVIGIGGGSPLDAAKAIALGAANNITGLDLYNGDLHQQCYPIIAIPTTSGTGSEVTQYSVLTNKHEQKKAGFTSPMIFPIVAFLDPRYTLSVSKTVTRDTALDALSHLLEGLYSVKRNQLLFPLIFEGIQLIMSHLPACLEDLSSFEHREALMRASLYGGMVIAHAGTTLQHSIGYPLTSNYGLSHGLANAVVMKGIMKLYSPAIQNELKQLFTYLHIEMSDFFKWIDDLGINQNLELEDEWIDKKILEIIQSRNMVNNPFIVEVDQIKQILKSL